MKANSKFEPSAHERPLATHKGVIEGYTAVAAVDEQAQMIVVRIPWARAVSRRCC